MRGSWNHPDGDNRSLGEKIKAEVDSTLRLLFKDVPQHSISTDLTGGMTVYLTEIGCETLAVSLDAAEPAVSDDPVTALKQTYRTQSLGLLPTEALLSDSYPCEMEPVLCHEPILEEMKLAWTDITFENVSLTASHEWAMNSMSTRSLSQSAEKFEKPGTKSLKSQEFRTISHSLSDTLPPMQAVNDPRFYALPIKKSPIPPNRFSPVAKEIFRKALAEKANTHPNNVQLRIVFERMDMTLFAGIQQDEQGNLLCTPKNELIGRNHDLHKGKTASSTMYLVYGFRLDNKEDVRALVPASSIKTNPEKTTS